MVLGDVALAGSLEVQLINQFVPSIGQQFLIVDNRGTNPVDGTFAGLPEGGLIWDGIYGFTITYTGGTGNDIVLTMSHSRTLRRVANAGGPYSVVEGGSLQLTGAGSSDGEQSSESLIYAWDLDGDGVFGESGTNAVRGDETVINPVFSTSGLNGPSEFKVSLRVTTNTVNPISKTFGCRF